MPKRMFCSSCNAWVDEPDVNSPGREWVRYHNRRCPKCASPLSEQPPAPLSVEEKKDAKLKRNVRKLQKTITRLSTMESASTKGESYVCDICGSSFTRLRLDKHFIKTAQQAVKIQRKSGLKIMWTGNVITFDDRGKAWCPHCFKNASMMRSSGRTVHAGERRPYLPIPNIGIIYTCKCGENISFNCRHVNIFNSLEVICEDCKTVMFVPPDIFEHLQSSEHQTASLRTDYRSLMKFR